MALDTDWAIDWTRRAADAVHAHRAELIALDREIGDGDHGGNLDRGFQAALRSLDSEGPFTAPGAVLRTVATALIASVGGASGPLFGTAYLRAGQAAGDAAELDGPTTAAVLAAARDGVIARGRAAAGDKTMVDAWVPAAQAAEAASAAGGSALEVLVAAAGGAAAGAADTEPLVARKGRASYLGDRSVGHRDPGAESTALILRTAVEAAEGRS